MKILDWQTKHIRDKSEELGYMHSWLEEQKFEWTPIVKNVIEQILNGKTLLISSDRKREWLKSYIISSINSDNDTNPLISIVDINPMATLLNSNPSRRNEINDLLNMTYQDNNYITWYIGSEHSTIYNEIISSKRDSFLWMITDKSISNAFCLNPKESMLDIRLLQMYENFESCLFDCIFGKIDLE